MTIRWTVSSDPVGCGKRFWFYVYIYDTSDELQRAAAQYRHEQKRKPRYWDGVAGCFQPHLSIWVPDEYENVKGIGEVPQRLRKSGKTTPFLGVMRLSREQMTVDTIIHESTHAACNYVNSLNLISGYKLCGGEIEKQEQLCYAAGEFAHAILKKAGLLQ